ncbi:hypothetical protein [Roseivirga pacifica]|uniref:hypothetical protein n=1 Tax=Roseivirga pacifica TaxID=1267423 RepID=UPI003BABED18
MTKKYLLSTAIALTLFLSACSAPTQLLESWAPPTIEAKSFDKIGIVMISQNEQAKENIEYAIAEEMRTKGYKATPTFNVFPFAGNKKVQEDLNLSAEEQQDYIRERINRFDFDALIVVSILDVEQEIKQRPSVGFSYSGPVQRYDANYTEYIQYTSASVYKVNYSILSNYFIEASMFDIESEELHWTGQYKIKDPSHLNKSATDFSDALVEELVKKSVITK